MAQAADTTESPQRPISRTFSLVSAVLAVFLWGGWAWFANAEAAVRLGLSPATPAIAQGICSGCMTLCMVRINTWLCRRWLAKPLAWLLPTAVIVSTVTCLLTLVHSLVATPNIVRTVAPALVVAFGFNLVTTFKIRQKFGQGHRQPGP